MNLPHPGRIHPFPWREEESVGGTRVQRPTVDVRLTANNLTHKTKALIDTGSPTCVFPRGAGDLLGVEFHYTPHRVRLMGGLWVAVRESVSMMLEPFEGDSWDADVLFVRDEGLPFALLGYEGFLNRWAVSFNGALGYFTVESADDFHRRQGPEVTEVLRREWPHLLPPEWT